MNHYNFRRYLLLAVTSICLVPLGGFSQGSLTPAGTPAPTMKALEQIEPRIDLQNAPAAAVTTTNAAYHFIINQPGSYYLSANLGVTKANGIQINAEGVTLDLHGFQISRASGSGGNGIEIAAISHRAGIRNGSLRGFAYGVRSIFTSSDARGCVFRDLSVSNCTTAGIATGQGAVLESCRAHGNSGTYGILAGTGSVLSNCAAVHNTTNIGIYAGNGCALTNCTAANNTGNNGIFTSFACSLVNCSAHENTSAAASSAGISTGGGSTISNCTAYANRSTAGTLTPTTGMGFELGSNSNIHGCTAFDNRGDGIKIESGTVARDNTCASNGGGGTGAGIHASSTDNRIEGNNVTANDRGIDVDTAGNVIIKNSASGNTTNYDLAANNVFGAIVDRTNPMSAAVTGSSAASSAATTDPWANISY